MARRITHLSSIKLPDHESHEGPKIQESVVVGSDKDETLSLDGQEAALELEEEADKVNPPKSIDVDSEEKTERRLLALDESLDIIDNKVKTDFMKLTFERRDGAWTKDGLCQESKRPLYLDPQPNEEPDAGKTQPYN